MNRVHIIGRKNSGKTTLIEELLRHLTAQGYRVGTVKHTHHQHELDVPGKDSHRHRLAGAEVVAILSPNMNAVFWTDPSDANEVDRYQRLATQFADCDLVLVEGNSATTGRKIEVWRKETNSEPLAAHDASVLAIVTDDEYPACPAPVWSRRDVPRLAEKIMQMANVPVRSRHSTGKREQTRNTVAVSQNELFCETSLDSKAPS